MNEDLFWQLIADVRAQSQGDVERQAVLLEKSVAALSPAEIIEWGEIYDKFRFMAYTRDLWAAAYIINGGCSDDGFEYFRGWLIAQGRVAFENALRDPDTLADVVDMTTHDYNAECEAMLYVDMNAYEAKTGNDMPERKGDYPKLTGAEWTEDDLNTKFPRLASVFFE